MQGITFEKTNDKSHSSQMGPLNTKVLSQKMLNKRTYQRV